MLSNHLFQSISYTLVHSLWLGLVLALAAALVIVGTRKKSSVLRYNLLASLMLVFIVSIGITFYLQIQTNKPVALPQASILEASQDASSPVLVTYNHHLQQQRQTVMERVAGFIDQYAGLIVSLWFIIFIFKCMRLFIGIREVHYLKHRNLSPVSPYWALRFKNLKNLLEIQAQVSLFESPLVKVPVVVGWFKPVILVPAGLLAQMPADQVEAVLLHELAHIRRKDYLVNMLQGLGETLFFFNPGFMWISSLLRTERENCCDDMALAITQSKTGLVHALVFSQQYQLNDNKLVLGFGRQKTPLLNRAKRILYNDNQSLSNMEKTFLSMCIFLGIGCLLAFNTATPDDSTTKKITQPVLIAEEDNKTPYSDRVYKPEDFEEGTALKYNDLINGHIQSTYLFKHDGVLYQVSGDIRLLKVNGKNIPQQDWGKYMPIIDKLMAEYSAELSEMDELDELAPLAALDEMAAEEPIDAPEPPPAPAAPGFPGITAPPAYPAYPGYPAYPAMPAIPAYTSWTDTTKTRKMTKEEQRVYEQQMKEWEQQMKVFEVEMKKWEEEMKVFEKNREIWEEEMKKAAAEMEKIDWGKIEKEIEDAMAEVDWKKVEEEMKRADKEMKNAEKQMRQADKELKKAAEQQREADKERAASDAVHQGLKRDLKSALGVKIESYGLTKTKLVVNGKEQSPALQKKMAEKYLKKYIDVSYHYDINSGRVFKGTE